jgi:hypothetical protein
MREENGLLSRHHPKRNAEQGGGKIQANPRVTNPIVELDGTRTCLSLKIRGSTSKAESRHGFSASKKEKIVEQFVKDSNPLINARQGTPMAPFSRKVPPNDAMLCTDVSSGHPDDSFSSPSV